MNKSLIFLIFNMYIFVSIQNSLHAMEPVEIETNVGRFEDKLEKEKISSALIFCIKKIEITKEKIAAKQRELTILTDAEQLPNDDMFFSNEESKIAVLKLTKIQLQKQKKQKELQAIKNKLQKLEQKKEKLIEKQKQETLNLKEQDQLRNKKIEEYEKLLEKYNVQKSTINQEVAKCYKLGEAPGKFVPEKNEEEGSPFLDFVKESYNSLEEKVCVFPVREWAKVVKMYPKTINWKADQKNTNLSIDEDSEIITNVVEKIKLSGKVAIKEEDIHHEGKMDSVVASLENNEIKYTITLDETTNINFPGTMLYRTSKNLAHAKNFMNPYGKILNDKVVGGSVGGFVGGGLGLLVSQVFNIKPELCIQLGATFVAVVSTLLAGGIKQEIEKEMEKKIEIEALNIQQSSQGVEEYSKLKIVSENRSYETNNNSNVIGDKYFIVEDEETAVSKQHLLNAAKNYPSKNKNLFIKRRDFVDENQKLLQPIE